MSKGWLGNFEGKTKIQRNRERERKKKKKKKKKKKQKKKKKNGLVRDLNPGPLAPKARIIPLDQRATGDKKHNHWAHERKQRPPPLILHFSVLLSTQNQSRLHPSNSDLSLESTFAAFDLENGETWETTAVSPSQPTDGAAVSKIENVKQSLKHKRQFPRAWRFVPPSRYP